MQGFRRQRRLKSPLADHERQATPPQAEPLLDEVMAAYRTGDLPRAWSAFLAFFEHPARNELAARIDGLCLRLRDSEVPAAGWRLNPLPLCSE